MADRILNGIEGVMRGLNERRRNYAKRFELAAKAAGEVILEMSQEVCPIDTGYLISSGFVLSTGTGWACIVTVGYSAPYAVYVHEDLSKAHGAVFNSKYAAEIAAGKEHSRRPQEKAKFLIDPIRKSQQDGSLARFFFAVVEGKPYRKTTAPLFVSPIRMSIPIPTGGYPIVGAKVGRVL